MGDPSGYGQSTAQSRLRLAILPAVRERSSTMAEITEREAAQIDQGQRERQDAGRLHPRALAAAEQLGQLGRSVRGGRLRGGDARPGPTTPRPSRRRARTPTSSRRRHLKQIADHTAEVIGGLDKKPAVMGHSTGGLLAPDDRRPGPVGGHRGDRPGAVPRRPAAAALGTEVGQPRCSRNPLNRGRAVTLTLRPVQVRMGERARARTRRSSCTRRTTSRRPAWR